MTCCQNLETASVGPSPFVRLLVTDYYDGPKEGFAECGSCRTAYTFRMLAWNGGQDVRVYALAPLDVSFDHIREHVLSLPSAGSKTLLVPPLAGDAHSKVDRLMGSSPKFVVATLDILDSFLAVRPISENAIGARDWFAWLALDEVTAER